ncbi:YhcH/YjgK/YiaL family protein [Mucilaginibacter sp. SMC90]|uniref:YhcH/YjgK/YiaL family protein n=1 Tax=Mucilaginibacter sp. SMC90 TaxID=2929803 RepID=UPI001FB395DB|nr:YhcH/YjgK/YiaL family protein [Mucilaginibacter sp. SMC90]UOE47525.1 YhcH/YjgK/YiaL family protein [Mucilaginibacter sp. SMC90]
MKHLTTYKNIMLVILFSLTAAGASAQQQEITAKSAKTWVKSRVWANGLKLKLNSSTNELEFAKQYAANKAAWDKAFEFIRERNLEQIEPGKYPIDGDNVYAMITEAPSKEPEHALWESHQNYIDLQYVIKGKEKIGVAPIESLMITKPYDAEKDFANYSGDGKYFTATPDEFFLFFPSDGHRPNMKVDGYDKVKKLVIKIKEIK